MNQQAITDRFNKFHGKGDQMQIGPTGPESRFNAPDIEPNYPEPLEPEDPMNKLEARFVQEVLEPQKIMGEIKDWAFEPIKVILEHGVKGKRKETTYRPDFWAIHKHITIYEVKGFMRDDAAVKIKIAAGKCPWFEWILVTRKKGEWIFKGV